MQPQPNIAKQAQLSGFVIPDITLDFPAPRAGLLLTQEQEQSFGFSMLQMTLDQIQALACDCEVVNGLLSEIEAGFSKTEKADKAVSLIKVDGQWIRHGSIDDKLFSRLARERIAKVRSTLACMTGLNANERDLFYVDALHSLRSALAELVPYDLILNKATMLFKDRCSSLSAACRDLVKFVAEEMHLAKPTALKVCEQFWLSNKLPAICFGANRYVQSIMPAKAKRDFRFGILERQQRIAKVALASSVPVIELLASWSSFNKLNQRSDRLAGAFAMINAGLAEKVAREYHFATDFDQVRSAAYQGLSRAINLYAPEKGLKFSTYAVTWIKQTIIRDLIQQEMVRLPEGSHAMLGRVRAVYSDMPHASDEYVCKAANINIYDLEGLRPYLLGTGVMSMDSTPNSDEEDSGLHAFIADENNDFVAALEEESDLAYIIGLVKDALTDREFFVLTHRNGLGGAEAKTVADLAQQLGTSPQNISRIEKNAQVKLAEVPGLKEVWESI